MQCDECFLNGREVRDVWKGGTGLETQTVSFKNRSRTSLAGLELGHMVSRSLNSEGVESDLS